MKLNRLITTAAILLAGAFCTAQAAPTMAKHMQKRRDLRTVSQLFRSGCRCQVQGLYEMP